MKKIAISAALALSLAIACNKVTTQREGGGVQDVRMYEDNNTGTGSTTGDNGKNGPDNTGEPAVAPEEDLSSTSGTTAGSVGGSAFGSTSGMTGGGTTAATTGFTTSQTVSTTGTTGGGSTSSNYKTTNKVGLDLDNPSYDSSQSNSGVAKRSQRDEPKTTKERIVPAKTEPAKQ